MISLYKSTVPYILTCTAALVISTIVQCYVTVGAQTTEQAVEDYAAFKECPAYDHTCKDDQVGFDHIAQLHAMIDDDKDGSLDREESSEFIRHDLKHKDSVPSREKNLHGADDHITVYDLWRIWVSSQVYNWTVTEVADWLVSVVELPQYANAFIKYSVDGKVLPRLSAMQSSLVSKLGIKNAVHRQKLTVKATDLVLFGPPKFTHNYKKDVALCVSLLVAVVGCYYAYTQHRSAQAQVQRVMKELGSLQGAEDSLSHLQQQLEVSQKQQQLVINDKLRLEEQLRAEVETARAEAERLRHQEMSVDSRNGEVVNEELSRIRTALVEAERRLQENSCLSLPDLQHWLCRTFDTETRYFNEKRSAAENQLRAAKEMCDKIRKQKGKVFGSFRVAHTTSLDETDNCIVKVRTALEDVKLELQERMNRWKQIERICGFNIINDGPGYSLMSSKTRGSKDELDNDSLSSFTSGVSADIVRRRAAVIHGNTVS